MPLKKRPIGRFSMKRIKKIIQLDDDVGKVAAAVPVVMSKALESFIEFLLKSIDQQAAQCGSTFLTSGIVKKCIMSEPKFDFLKGLVANIPCGPTGPEEMGSSSSGSQTPTSLSPQTTSQSSNFTFSTSRAQSFKTSSPRSYNYDSSKIKQRSKLKKHHSFMDDEMDLGDDTYCNVLNLKPQGSCNTAQIAGNPLNPSLSLQKASSFIRESSNAPKKILNGKPAFKRSQSMFTHSSKPFVQNTQEIKAGTFTFSLSYPVELSPDSPVKTLTTVPSFFTAASLPTCKVWSNNDGIDEDYDS